MVEPSPTAAFSANINRRKTRKKGKKSSSKSSSSSSNTTPSLQTIVRIRPLIGRKERDDHTVVEAVQSASVSTSNSNISTVVLHPVPQPDETASSQLVRHNFCAQDGLATSHDVEYRFDAVLDHSNPNISISHGTTTTTSADGISSSSTAVVGTQERLYSAVGQPATLQAMKNLKSSKDRTALPQLLVITGNRQGGKSYSMIGPHPSKLAPRQQELDGLVPLMMDSLFRQSQHQSSKMAAVGDFLISLSVYLVRDVKACGENKPGLLVDLLQSSTSSNNSNSTPTKRAAAGIAKSIAFAGSAAKKSTAVKSLVATFERTVPLKASPANKTIGHDAGTNPIFLQQDEKTSDYRVVNGRSRLCSTESEAREAIAQAAKRAAKIRSNHEHEAAHMVIQMQPLLVDARKHIVKRGSEITVLELAAGSSSNNNNMPSATKRGCKDDVPRRQLNVTGFDAVLKCLEAVQKRNNASPQESKIPYQQHNLTLLLQPVLCWDPIVQVVLCVSPGHGDYNEKRFLFEAVSKLPIRPPDQPVVTGFELPQPTTNKEVSSSKKSSSASKSKSSSSAATKSATTRTVINCKIKYNGLASDADDERSDRETARLRSPEVLLKKNKSPREQFPEITKAPSMTYSDTTNEDEDDGKGFLNDEYLVPIPPPPTARDISTRALPQYVRSPEASAPQEEDESMPNLSITPRYAKLPSMMDVLETSQSMGQPQVRSSRREAVLPELEEEACRDVFQKTSAVEPSQTLEKKQASSPSFQERIRSLKEENKSLRRENDRLMERTKELEAQIDTLQLTEKRKSYTQQQEPDSPALRTKASNTTSANTNTSSSNALGTLSKLVKAKKQELNAQENPWQRFKKTALLESSLSPAPCYPGGASSTMPTTTTKRYGNPLSNFQSPSAAMPGGK